MARENKYEESQTLAEVLYTKREIELENVHEDLLTEDEILALETKQMFNDLTRNSYEEI